MKYVRTLMIWLVPSAIITIVLPPTNWYMTLLWVVGQMTLGYSMRLNMDAMSSDSNQGCSDLPKNNPTDPDLC